MTNHIFNLEQVPMPFAIDCKTTNEVNIKKEGKRNHRVFAVNPGSGVDADWQQNAWSDIQFSLEWIQNTLKAGTFYENRKKLVLFCENLFSQISDEFLEAVKNINGIVWFGVSGATDIWQSVDCGIWRKLKQLVSRIQSEWLEHDDNINS